MLLPTSWGRIQLWRETYQPAGPRATEVYIVRFLGSRGRAELATLDRADRLPNVASEVWTMNPPGFGRTTRPPDLARFASSAREVPSHVAEIARGEPLVVCGKSIGTTAALAAVGARGGSDVCALVLRNAMPLRELLKEHYRRRTFGLSALLAAAVPPELDSIANASRCHCPALFLVSLGDRVVPPAHQQRVIDAYGGPTTVLDVAGEHDQRTLMPEDEACYRTALRAIVGACGAGTNPAD